MCCGGADFTTLLNANQKLAVAVQFTSKQTCQSRRLQAPETRTILFSATVDGFFSEHSSNKLIDCNQTVIEEVIVSQPGKTFDLPPQDHIECTLCNIKLSINFFLSRRPSKFCLFSQICCVVTSKRADRASY